MPSPAISMKSDATRTASSFEPTLTRAKPSMSSLVSAKGPSTSCDLPPGKLIRTASFGGVEAVHVEQDAGLVELPVVAGHGPDRLPARDQVLLGRGRQVGVDEEHESHRFANSFMRTGHIRAAAQEADKSGWLCPGKWSAS